MKRKQKDFFKELPFHNEPIEKSYIKRLNNTDLLDELPFHSELVL